MVAFNSHIRGAEGDGSTSVAEAKKERRPSGTDAHAKELAGGIGVAACRTPFRDSRNEASIRVPRMFHSHIQ
jgi:hypothetical protein